MEGFIEVLKELYDEVSLNFPLLPLKVKNQVVLDYLRKEEYSKRKQGLASKVWDVIFAPSRLEVLESKVDSELKDDAENYTKNIPIGKSKIEVPHLAATILGYLKSSIQFLSMPRYQTVWGGDFATLVGELINKGLTDENKLYEKAMELLGGESTFSDSDIDAIYFARNLEKAPIYDLVKTYYSGLEYKRKELIISDIGGNSNESLAIRIQRKFTGNEGLGYSIDVDAFKFIRGFGLKYFINKEAKEVEYSTQTLGNAITAASKAFANKIETLQNGFLK